jgi:hypothetical protein
VRFWRYAPRSGRAPASSPGPAPTCGRRWRGGRSARAGALTVGAIVDLNVNRLDRSAERFDEALALFQRGGDARGVAGILDGRAMAAFPAGSGSRPRRSTARPPSTWTPGNCSRQ